MKFSRPKFPSRRRPVFARGFTLIEIMVAVMIFMMVVAAIYATLMLIIRATRVGQSAAARAQRERVAMRTIESSLLCAQSFQASQKYYSFLVQNGDEPELSFVARAPEAFPRNAKFSGFNLRRMTFSLEAGDDGQKNLVLRQNPILMDVDDDEQQNPLILEKNVKQFSVECWDTNQDEWVSEWDNTNAIPPMVLVELDIAPNDDRNHFSDDADLTLIRVISPPASMMPTAVQMGAGGFGAPVVPSAPGQPGQPPGQITLPPPQ